MQQAPVFIIPLLVRFELGTPEIQTALRQTRELASRITVTMPETTVNENDFLLASENEVGPAGQVLSVKTVTKS
jgi:hypothetical protein